VSQSSEFSAITLYVASQRVILKVSAYFVIDSVRKLLDTPSYTNKVRKEYPRNLQKTTQIKGSHILWSRDISDCSVTKKQVSGMVPVMVKSDGCISTCPNRRTGVTKTVKLITIFNYMVHGIRRQWR
jgi:hypothetical protein